MQVKKKGFHKNKYFFLVVGMQVGSGDYLSDS